MLVDVNIQIMISMQKQKLGNCAKKNYLKQVCSFFFQIHQQR